MTPQQYCLERVRLSQSNFANSFLLLAPSRRRAIIALYAFCREVDDVVDNVHEPAIAQAKLDWWRQEIANMFDGNASHPVSLALAEEVRTYQLPQTWLQEIIDGMEMDLQHNRYETFAQLQLYCHRVAAVVGWCVAQILGYRSPLTLKYAHALGMACQLTNIIRDVSEDAERGRVYLPLEELSRFSVSPENILHHQVNEEFAALMKFQTQRAQDFFHRAWSLLPQADTRAQCAGIAMGSTYHALLEQIQQYGFRPPLGRVSLATPYVLWIISTSWLSPRLRVTLNLRRFSSLPSSKP